MNQRSLLSTNGFSALVIAFVAGLTAIGQEAAEPPKPQAGLPEPAAKRDLEWRQTDTSIALLNHGQVVWQHVHDKQLGKPYVRFGLIDGTELTRPCPIPEGYPKADHTWHRALWWSWKAIDGVNYWEQNQQGTEPVEVTIARHDDGSARIDATIAYHLPDHPPVVIEKRVVAFSAPDATGTYHVDWQATFQPAGETEVVFNRNSYGGLAIRMAAECCGDVAAGRPGWEFFDSERRSNCNGQSARWVGYSGILAGGQAACVAVFDHPDNPRHPSWWQTRSHYPYLNPSFTCREDYTLPAGESLTLRYRILVHHGSADAEALDRHWAAFAKRPRDS